MEKTHHHVLQFVFGRNLWTQGRDGCHLTKNEVFFSVQPACDTNANSNVKLLDQHHNFQTGGSDPPKQVISERVRGNESVPRWVVSIEVSEDESVRGVRKDVRIEGPGARIRRIVSDGRGVEVKKLKRRVLGEKDFNTGVV